MGSKPPVRQVFGALEVPIVYDGDGEVRYLCPFHMHSGRSRHNSAMNKDTGKWQCWNASCGARGLTLASFVARKKSIDYEEAVNWLATQYGYSASEAIFEQSIVEKSVICEMPLPSTYRKLPGNFDYIKQEGFLYEHLEQMHVGVDMEVVDGRFKYDGALLIPFFHNGVCVGWAYKFYGAKYIYNFPKKFFLYGYDYARWSDEVTVVEGLRDCWRVRQHGDNCVALGGCYASKWQINLLLKNWSKITIALDGDDAGRGGTQKLISELDGLVDLRVIDMPDGMDPCDMDRDTWKKLERKYANNRFSML